MQRLHAQQAEGTPQLAKAPTGIEGFDEISGGGLPRGRTTLVMGGAGSGKTVFALQSLVNGAQQLHEPGIFVAFEESSHQIVANAGSFGWDLPALQQHQLFFLDAKLPATVSFSGRFDLEGLLAGLRAKVAEMGATRIVFDGLDVLLNTLNDPVAERQEIHRLHEWLLTQQLTAIITSKITSDEPEPDTRYGFMHFLMDCTVLLRQVTKGHIALRKLRILKYRGSGFFENETPLLIGPAGIEVVGPGLQHLHYAATTERIATGVAALDGMLAGGYLRGSAVLLTGSPGTAKSTLAGAFAQAASLRGEPTLYVSFDENDQELIRNLHSVGIHLEPHVERGTLRIHTSRIESWSAEAYMLELRALIRQWQPRCLILDPITALLKGGGESEAMAVAQRLFTFAKASGITMVMTSLLANIDAMSEASRIPISTLADTWIHLSYLDQGGERNRALTIIKARGTKHSNQVRELILDDSGVHLAEVFTAGGEVLMGTLRWEREQAAAEELARQRQLMARRRRELQVSEAELTVRLEAIRQQVEVQRAELEELARLEAEQEAQWASRMREVTRLRQTDGRE